MKFLSATLALFALSTGVLGIDHQAIEKCRSIHHQTIGNSSVYQESGCMLNCILVQPDSIDVAITVVDDGARCVQKPAGTCHKGKCVIEQAPQKAAAFAVRPKLGFIDVEMVSAQLANQANAYMGVCIQNSTAPVTLPISDRSKCVSCTTNTVNSRNPIWKSVCSQSGRYRFVNESRVTFEIFDHIGQGNNFFMGGATLTLPQVLKNGDNNREIGLNMAGGSNAGSMRVRITWTPN